jgi:hypothetical protein
MTDAPSKVFISYSHDTVEHQECAESCRSAQGRNYQRTVRMHRTSFIDDVKKGN